MLAVEGGGELGMLLLRLLVEDLLDHSFTAVVTAEVAGTAAEHAVQHPDWKKKQNIDKFMLKIFVILTI